MEACSQEVRQNKRFAFGKNWQRFMEVLDEERIAEAMKSLRTMLGMENFEGKSFLDIGSGSGLFSLAAMRLGANRVHSFDYDPQSVACGMELKRRYFPDARTWTLEEGSALDPAYIASLGQFDIVYSWGVLHHTGNMWQALENVVQAVQARGMLFIAIYNDQGDLSRIWKAVKVRYLKSFAWRLIVTPPFLAISMARGLYSDLRQSKNPISRYTDYKKRRGMSYWPDVIDWLGGYPFEYAKPEQIFDFYRRKGFTLVGLTTAGGKRGNNQYVFTRDLEVSSSFQDLGVTNRQVAEEIPMLRAY